MPDAPPVASIILLANNEADYIGACLTALVTQEAPGLVVQILVVANACSDDTAERARAFADRAAARGWTLAVIEQPEGGKLRALNTGDACASGAIRIYLDADIICGPTLLAGIVSVLSTERPLYATGRLRVKRANTATTRAYATFWQTLPFVQSGAVGTGLYAVNAAGRARWGDFPDIISDDTFVRIQFAPTERVEVDATYDWPMVEGLNRLVRVRRRQDRGVAELSEGWPELMPNEGKAVLTRRGLLRRAVRHPLAFAIYALVSIRVRLSPGDGAWIRGR